LGEPSTNCAPVTFCVLNTVTGSSSSSSDVDANATPYCASAALSELPDAFETSELKFRSINVVERSMHVVLAISVELHSASQLGAKSQLPLGSVGVGVGAGQPGIAV